MRRSIRILLVMTGQPFLTAILITGAERQAFLQGQLSSDVRGLQPGICQLAALNSAQGRVQAVLTLALWAAADSSGDAPEEQDGIVAIIPANLADDVLARLRRYVLRSKVKVAVAGALPVRGASAAALRLADLPVPDAPLQSLAFGAHGDRGRGLVLSRPGDDRHSLVLGVVPALEAMSGDEWRLTEIRAGLPQVHPQTVEAFVAQMLNMDLLGAISFEKGCYTGQEVIARTHYRGSIKRRMLRFHAACPPPAPGTRLLQDEGAHAGDVVDAAPVDGGCELLAVVPLGSVSRPLVLDAPDRPVLERRSLPYPMPAAA